jgi:photosystem II stability/assembly factor-like uncharacterized protein
MIAALAIAAAAAGTVHGQWEIENSHTSADLRGIASVGKGIAWASGANGTVLRTEDGGYLWQTCAAPEGGEKLDFRGIQAFDANTAIVMSTGNGDLSRLYKTTDGCNSWKLLLANPDPDGFWDAVRAADPTTILILGDPVKGAFQIRETTDGGETWTLDLSEPIWYHEGAYAASNSSLLINWVDGPAVFGTGAPVGARIFRRCDPCKKQTDGWAATPMKMFPRGASAGIFALHQSSWDHLVAVGGDYKAPDRSEDTAAWSNDGGRRWHRARVFPHGYRSAVDFDVESNAWVTVGPNGTDVSRDEGRDWQPLRPGPGEPADADKNWNALSLPFVVGPKGRIGKWKGLPEAHAAQANP